MDIYDAMGMAEELGCSEKHTALVSKLGEIGEYVELLVDQLEKLNSEPGTE